MLNNIHQISLQKINITELVQKVRESLNSKMKSETIYILQYVNVVYFLC